MRIKTTTVELMLAERGLQKKDFAVSAGLSRQSMSTILRRGTCQAATAIKIARALGVDVTEIIEEGRV